MFVRIIEATSAEDRERLFRFRYRIYAEELKKRLPGMNHELRTYRDPQDEYADLLAAVDQDTGRIVGTARTMRPSRGPLPEHIAPDLNMEPMIQALGADAVSYTSAMMVDPAYRGKTVASLLALALYRKGLRAGLSADVCVSEIGLVRLYHQLGYRPYWHPFRPHAGSGLRVPMVIAVPDKGYLETVDSPFKGLCRATDDDGGETIRRIKALYPLCVDPPVSPTEKRALCAALAHGPATPETRSIFHDFEPEEIEDLLETYPQVTIAAGENLYREGEIERGMGVILEGRLGVSFDFRRNPHILAVLGEGEVCGEMSSLLGTDRTANLVALEESRILFLPSDLLERLATKDPSAAARAGRNLATIIASRLLAMNRQVKALMDRVPTRYMRSLENWEEHTSGSRPGAEQSYAITTLDDPDRELARLERQALLGRAIELYHLRRFGFQDGRTFLDLGSGPGLTSFMLARTFTDGQIIGIEPDPFLRARAQELAAHQGLGDRCRFVEGKGETLPLEDDSVDYCYARFVFQHLPDPGAVLKELARVTRPGGAVVVMDVDDAGVVVYPEPAGLEDFQDRTAEAQARLGGDRHISRKLKALMLDAGLLAPRIEVAPVTPEEVPFGPLIDAAFSFKEQALRRSGLWEERDQEVLDELKVLPGQPGAFLCVPIFFGNGLKPMD
jgi:ubiquinone/menaquinone biosynthesis C-methylase UbiE/GNAT superfamily N-acetyltransferase